MYAFVAANVGAVLGGIRVAKRLSGELRCVLGTPYLPSPSQLERLAETISLIKGSGLPVARAAIGDLAIAHYWLEIAADPQAHRSARRVGREKSLHFLSSAEAALDRLATRLSH